MTTVKILVNHFLISDGNGHETRLNFGDLTSAEETELRAEAQAQRQPRNSRKAKSNSRSRAGSQPSSKVNYAALVVGRDSAGVNINKI